VRGQDLVLEPTLRVFGVLAGVEVRLEPRAHPVGYGKVRSGAEQQERDEQGHHVDEQAQDAHAADRGRHFPDNAERQPVDVLAGLDQDRLRVPPGELARETRPGFSGLSSVSRRLRTARRPAAWTL
jgi:hypothetical protein